MRQGKGMIAGLILVFLGLGAVGAKVAQETPAARTTALVLTAFGTSTAAADTYQYMEKLFRERFPGYEICWAFTSQKIREKLKKAGRGELKDLSQTLGDLKAAGMTRVVVQSLHVVPGEEWQEMARESRRVPGLKVALGKPLLSSPGDRKRLLEALTSAFPKDLKENAVILVGHGSPHPEGEAAYLDFEALVRSRFAGKNVFLGVVDGKPEAEAALEAVKRSEARKVIFVPLLVVAGDHMQNDILGDEPGSWKSRLLAHRPFQVEGAPGLGYRKEVVAIFMDHLEEALKSLTP
jgi:sirohydrochlorin cobaltochelatase